MPLAAVLLAATPAMPAAAQAYQCTPPARLAAPPPIVQDGPRRIPPLRGYTVALSWSPEFCRTRQRQAGARLQCSGAMGRFGFIVHGLWPEARQGWPQWCRPVRPPSPALIRGQLCRTPAPALIAHEWAKHGSCMARSPAGHFKVSNILADSLAYPEMERLSRDRALSAGALRQAFAAANPGRPAASFGLVVSDSGWLREVMVCLDKRFRPASCAAHQRGPRDAAPLKVWRGL